MANKVTIFLKSLVNFSDEIDLNGAGASIRKNVYFRGLNVFILICAIIIASVGLNVNSIPVIIGAMLISPVMGPILGFGFSLGVQDLQLLKDSLINLLVMVVISILASTLYFVLSPLTVEHPTELLARTNPTIYDVLIAFFGGFAGIFENSRKEKGTVLAGVAIATALMPPLCTVGYGISVLNWSYIIGAFYLFTINSVFIALATIIGVKYIGYPAVSEGPAGTHVRLTKRAVYVIILIIIVPSIFSAVAIVKESNFRIQASNLVEENRTIGKSFIYDYEVDVNSKPSTVEIFLAGETLSEADRERLYGSAATYGITREQIILREEAVRTDGISDSEIVKSIYARSDSQIQALTDSIESLSGQLDYYKSMDLHVDEIWNELSAQYPGVTALTLTRGYKTGKEFLENEEGVLPEPVEIVAIISSDKALTTEQLATIQRWLRVRTGASEVTVVTD